MIYRLLKGNRVQGPSSPAAVRMELFQVRNAATGEIPGRFEKVKMSEPEDLLTSDPEQVRNSGKTHRI